eukprot:TRINITY_DN3847_c0_g3_i1.p1 TRINITY_DN3847_c0_g3~~TRINITY_DN3847_c0_g3_i1.p1  ORF type:complete len:116 (+),score=24.29 TRINITY_DN3847_c0_g3_i1:53-349(+)
MDKGAEDNKPDDFSIEALGHEVVASVLDERERGSTGSGGGTPRGYDSEGSTTSLAAMSEVAGLMMGPTTLCEQCSKQIATNLIEQHQKVWCTAIQSSW